MLLDDEYKTIDNYMSDSNVGGRKDRGIRDDLFVVNGIIQEHCTSQAKPVTIQIFDYKTCFDSLWQDKVINELYDAGVQDDKLALLPKINETNIVKVKTPAGLSDAINVEKTICQGDPWGSMECGIIVDGFGKESLKPEMEPYQYRGTVPVPLLGMVDDILYITESGYKACRANAFINAKTVLKRLQFGTEKCQLMYVGKNIQEHKKIELYVDGWKMQEVQDELTGDLMCKETFDGEHELDVSNVEKYLGQILSNDGSNVKNVASRSGKGSGMVNTIESIISNVPGGKFHFEIAVIMRNAYLISSMLSCSETWYNVTENDLRKLEQVDESLMRKIFNFSSQVTSEILSLELGLLPVRYIIMLRRIIYFQQILKQKSKNSLIYQFLSAQMQNPKRNDWYIQVQKDLEVLDITENIQNIETMSKEKYKTICKTQVKKKAFIYLINKKNSHEKVGDIQYKQLKISEYLGANNLMLSVIDRQFLFHCRVSDIDARANRTWKYQEIYCISCKDRNTIETGKHILECSVLNNQNDKISYIPTYNELYSNNIQDQAYTSTTIKENMKIRESYMTH